jgi:hypothetical protein
MGQLVGYSRPSQGPSSTKMAETAFGLATGWGHFKAQDIQLVRDLVPLIEQVIQGWRTNGDE